MLSKCKLLQKKYNNNLIRMCRKIPMPLIYDLILVVIVDLLNE